MNAGKGLYLGSCHLPTRGQTGRAPAGRGASVHQSPPRGLTGPPQGGQLSGWSRPASSILRRVPAEGWPSSGRLAEVGEPRAAALRWTEMAARPRAPSQRGRCSAAGSAAAVRSGASRPPGLRGRARAPDTATCRRGKGGAEGSRSQSAANARRGAGEAGNSNGLGAGFASPQSVPLRAMAGGVLAVLPGGRGPSGSNAVLPPPSHLSVQCHQRW